MGSLFQDLRFAARSLRRAPGFALAAVLTLGLGIGASTAIFSVVDAVLLRPLPYPQASRLIHLWEFGKDEMSASGSQASLANIDDWRRTAKTLDRIAAYRYWLFNVTGGPAPEALLGAYVSADFFPTLGVQPALGRTFLASEDRPGEGKAVVISDALWRRRFAADPGVVGRTVQVDGAPHTVVGVMPKGFEFPATLPGDAALPTRELDVWAPLAVDPSTAGRGQHNWWALGRLAPGATVEQARAEMARIGRETHARFPEAHAFVGVRELRAHVVDSLRPVLLILLGAVGIVLLVACANVANLLLARGTARTREVALRAAVGASRPRIVRHVLAESVVLSLAGAAAGVMLARAGVAGLVMLAPQSLPRVAGARVDGAALGWALALSVATALAFGALPAFHASRVMPYSLLRGGGRGSTAGRVTRRSRNVLVVAEIAVSLVLLASAGLLVRSYRSLSRVDPGFRADHVLTGFTLLPETRFPDSRTRAAFFTRAVERLEAIPGVTSAAAISSLPLSGMGNNNSFHVQGTPPVAPADRPNASTIAVTPDAFRTLEIPLLSGRRFGAGDDAGSTPVAIVSATLARLIAPRGSPIGLKLQDVGDGPLEIVGVVGDVHVEGLASKPGLAIYMPMAQQPDIAGAFAVRTSGDPMRLEKALRGAVAAVDPNQPVMNLRTLQSYLDGAVEERRFHMYLLAAFAATAALLAVVGLYAVLGYVVGLRSSEFGVRVALGADRGDILRLVLGGGARLTAAGLAAGLAGAAFAGKLVASQLYGVSATDPVTLAATAALLMSVALLASWLPARRASRVDPVVALRSE
ncbi:MAG TPA: ABC transporter permease [Longimicrobium sp.]|jgi:putative ABC transport system permease protein